MRHLARTLHALAVLALLAAIWAPGLWWSWLLTAVLLLFVGAALTGSNLPEDDTTEPQPTGNSTGPHIHIAAHGYSPDDIAAELARQQRKHDAITPEDVQQYKRQYGRKADDQ